MKSKILQNKNKLLHNLFESKAYYGNSIKSLNINSFVYLTGIRNRIGIIDLGNSIKNFKRSLLLIQYLIQQRKGILFVSNSVNTKFLQKTLEKSLLANSIKLIANDWLPGYLTKLNSREIKKINLIILFNLNQNEIIINESIIKKIPVIAFIDTNFNPNIINYPVIVNTSNIKTLFFLSYCFRKFLYEIK